MIRIVGDTLSCITPAEAETLNLPLLPQLIIFGETTYRDDFEISSTEFLEKLQNSTSLPKTAAPPPNLYFPIFEEARKNGDTVIVLCPSASLSGTYRSAIVAAQDFPDVDIHIQDTNLIAAGLGSVIRAAQKRLTPSTSPDEILSFTEHMAKLERLYILVDTLEYLHKGGRIGGAKALFGSLLQIKPILTMEKGVIQPVESQRTKKAALNRIKELVMESRPDPQSGHLCVQHGGAEQEAAELAAWLSEQLEIGHIPVFNLPPAILVHAGPKALGVSFFQGE
jgi:DegV family protein with EDD domain